MHSRNVNKETMMSVRHASMTRTPPDFTNHHTHTTSHHHHCKGRKGDDRYHRAVLARWQNPSLSLFDALAAGGFDYQNDEDQSAVDSEQVTLAQRKNQLSRRLRLAKKQQQQQQQQEQQNDESLLLTVLRPTPPQQQLSSQLSTLLSPQQQVSGEERPVVAYSSVKVQNEPEYPTETTWTSPSTSSPLSPASLDDRPSCWLLPPNRMSLASLAQVTALQRSLSVPNDDDDDDDDNDQDEPPRLIHEKNENNNYDHDQAKTQPDVGDADTTVMLAKDHPSFHPVWVVAPSSWRTSPVDDDDDSSSWMPPWVTGSSSSSSSSSPLSLPAGHVVVDRLPAQPPRTKDSTVVVHESSSFPGTVTTPTTRTRMTPETEYPDSAMMTSTMGTPKESIVNDVAPVAQVPPVLTTTRTTLAPLTVVTSGMATTNTTKRTVGGSLVGGNGGRLSLESHHETSLSSGWNHHYRRRPRTWYYHFQPLVHRLAPPLSSAAAAVAMSGLNRTAQEAMGLSLEQVVRALNSGRGANNLLRVLLTNHYHHHKGDTKNPVWSSNGGGGTTVWKERLLLALQLFDSKVQALYAKSMQMAGFDRQDCYPPSKVYLDFIKAAWHQQKRRWQALCEIGNDNGVRVIEDVAMEDNDEPDDWDGDSHGNDSDSSSNCDEWEQVVDRTTCWSVKRRHVDVGMPPPTSKGDHWFTTTGDSSVHKGDQHDHGWGSGSVSAPMAIVHLPQDGSGAHVDLVPGDKAAYLQGIHSAQSLDTGGIHSWSNLTCQGWVDDPWTVPMIVETGRSNDHYPATTTTTGMDNDKSSSSSLLSTLDELLVDHSTLHPNTTLAVGEEVGVWDNDEDWAFDFLMDQALEDSFLLQQ